MGQKIKKYSIIIIITILSFIAIITLLKIPLFSKEIIVSCSTTHPFKRAYSIHEIPSYLNTPDRYTPPGNELKNCIGVSDTISLYFIRDNNINETSNIPKVSLFEGAKNWLDANWWWFIPSLIFISIAFMEAYILLKNRGTKSKYP